MNSRTVCVLLCTFTSVGQVLGETNDFVCGSLQNAYGPYDFRFDKSKLPIVEGAHLTPDVVNLVKGSTGKIGGDLDYTLRAIPNHPVALMAMVRLGAREKSVKPRGAHYTVECYLYRANLFGNNDSMVKMIYAAYLAQKGQNEKALNYLNEAVQLGGESANLYYNIGLVYLDLKQYDKALKNAHLAYQMGFPLPGLRDRLKMKGKWSEASSVADSGDDQKSEEIRAIEAAGEKPYYGTVR